MEGSDMEQKTMLKTKTTTSINDVNNLIRDGWNLWNATPKDDAIIYLLLKDVAIENE